MERKKKKSLHVAAVRVPPNKWALTEAKSNATLASQAHRNQIIRSPPIDTLTSHPLRPPSSALATMARKNATIKGKTLLTGAG